MKLKYSVEEIRSIVGVESVEGEYLGMIEGIGSLEEAKEGDLSFLGNMKYRGQVAESSASVILVPEGFEGSPRERQVYFRVKNPSMALAKVCRDVELMLWPKLEGGVHASAVVEAGAEVDRTANIGAFCYVGEGAKVGAGVIIEAHGHVGREAVIGEGCCLMAGSKVLDYCKLGNRVILQPGAVIGSHGFGYETAEGVHEKVPQVGIVELADDVEVGANTTVDRARFGVTRIGEGTKVDNLVQIAHNVEIGRGCFVISQTGIAGSSVIEDYCVIGGQVGIAGHLRIGKGSKIGSQSGLGNNVKAGSFVRGSPALPFMLAQKTEVLKKRLPDLFKRVKNIEEVIESLKVEH